MEAGRVIGGKYRLRREIGKGAMGSVWAAVHESLGRSVAVKFLRPTGLNPDTAAARFVAEARMAAAVKHRYVVDIFDFGITEDGNSYMVLDLLEGEELGERMYYGPPMLVSDAVRFVCQCLSGLEAVHDAGIVHRDLKPENIFILSDVDGPFPTLLDFGISKMNGDMTTSVSLRPPRMGGGRPVQLTMPGTVIGTPWYMAPEQLRGLSSIDARADIFGMGVILWEWIVGRVPYDDDNIGDLLVHLLRSGPPDLQRVRPGLGPELAKVLQVSMATKREQRYQSAREMREALHPLIEKLPQAWTVVQKSIVDMSSAEVLGVDFPSEAPTHRLTEVVPRDNITTLDELAAVARVQARPERPPSPLRTKTPEPQHLAMPLPVPPPAAGALARRPASASALRERAIEALSPLRGYVAIMWAKAAPLRADVKLRGQRVWAWLAPVRVRLSASLSALRERAPVRLTSLGAVGLSLALLAVVALLSGGEEPQASPPSHDMLLTAAAAQPAPALDAQGAPAKSRAESPVSIHEPPADAAREGRAPASGEAAPADSAAPKAAGDTDAAAEAGASTATPSATEGTPVKPMKKRLPQRTKRKQKRLYRSLDF